jgi:hypothetical protein
VCGFLPAYAHKATLDASTKSCLPLKIQHISAFVSFISGTYIAFPLEVKVGKNLIRSRLSRGHLGGIAITYQLLPILLVFIVFAFASMGDV